MLQSCCDNLSAVELAGEQSPCSPAQGPELGLRKAPLGTCRFPKAGGGEGTLSQGSAQLRGSSKRREGRGGEETSPPTPQLCLQQLAPGAVIKAKLLQRPGLLQCLGAGPEHN